MFCTHCGTKLPEQANFCWNCGKSINGKSVNESPAKQLLSPLQIQLIYTANLTNNQGGLLSFGKWDKKCSYILDVVETNQLTGKVTEHHILQTTAELTDLPTKSYLKLYAYVVSAKDVDIYQNKIQALFETFHNQGYNVYSILASAREQLLHILLHDRIRPVYDSFPPLGQHKKELIRKVMYPLDIIQVR